jgi:hypothetical protein
MITQGGMYCDACKQELDARQASIVVHLSINKTQYFHYFCLAQKLNKR